MIGCTKDKQGLKFFKRSSNIFTSKYIFSILFVFILNDDKKKNRFS